MTRLGYTAELGYESGSTIPRLDLWDALLEAGPPLGMAVIGMDVLDLLRIEGGFIIGGVEYDSTVSPYECGLGWSVDFSKTSLPARDALARDRNATRRRLASVVLESGGADASAAVLVANGAEVGYVTQAIISPHLGGATLGLASWTRRWRSRVPESRHGSERRSSQVKLSATRRTTQTVAAPRQAESSRVSFGSPSFAEWPPRGVLC